MRHCIFRIFLGWLFALELLAFSFSWKLLAFVVLIFLLLTFRKILFLGLILGLLHGSIYLLIGSEKKDPESSPATVRIHLKKSSPRGCHGTMEEYLGFYSVPLPCEEGQIWEGQAKIQTVFTGNKILRVARREFRDRQSLWGRLRWTRPPQLVGRDLTTFQSWRLRLKESLQVEERHIHALRLALFLGEGSLLPSSYWKALNELGLSHLLVASGSHLTVAFLLFGGLIQWILRRSLGSRGLWVKDALLFVVGLATTFVAGADLSMLRAFLCFLLARLLCRFIPWLHRYSSLDRLGLAGILLLLSDAAACSDSTFLLSFGASAVVLGLAQMEGFPRLLAFSLLPTFGVQNLLRGLDYPVHPLSFLFNSFFSLALGFFVLPLLAIGFFLPSLVNPWLEGALEEGFGIILSLSQTKFYAANLFPVPLFLGIFWLWVILDCHADSPRRLTLLSAGAALSLGLSFVFKSPL